jgi:predicted aconitase with swiveling domain
MTEFRAIAAMGKRAQGRDPFSARYDLDRINGLFSRPDHKLAGQSYVGRILVLDAAKGGVATAWMLHDMAARRVMPAALVLNRVNPIMVQGAALADFTMISGFDVDITASVPNHALVEVDPESDPPCLRILETS